MHSRLFLFSTAVFISLCSTMAVADNGEPGVPYTLQVGAFPTVDLANDFVVKLVHAGEHPACATIDLQGRGYWTRVLVGLFSTSVAARRYGENLIARGVVSAFLVRKAELEGVTRPRRVTQSDPVKKVTARSSKRFLPAETAPKYHSEYLLVGRSAEKKQITGRTTDKSSFDPDRETGAFEDPLAEFRAAALELAPCVDTGLIPRPDPVALAVKLVIGESRISRAAFEARGGLWLTGDAAEGLDRLRWIVGSENAELVTLSADGRVQLDRRLLAKAAGLDRSRVEDPVQVANYISSNEGLLLMVQLAEGKHRYRVHLGQQIPTRGKSVEITGSINLDWNFDSRINPYRKDSRKLDSEQPPAGFDSLIGMNPVARWFNLSTNDWVQPGEILFHELSEAYAKVEFGLDYLEHGSEPGAHALALDRERRLKSQRPADNIVLTAGSNRVLRTQQEIRLFYAESPGGVSQR